MIIQCPNCGVDIEEWGPCYFCQHTGKENCQCDSCRRKRRGKKDGPVDSPGNDDRA